MRLIPLLCVGLLGAAASAQPVATPGGFVPQHAIAFGARGEAATAVDADHGLPVADRANSAFPGATALTVGTPASAGRSFLANCTARGAVALTLADASSLTVPVEPGLTILPFAVTTVNAAGTTATCSFANLK